MDISSLNTHPKSYSQLLGLLIWKEGSVAYVMLCVMMLYGWLDTVRHNVDTSGLFLGFSLDTLSLYHITSWTIICYWYCIKLGLCDINYNKYNYIFIALIMSNYSKLWLLMIIIMIYTYNYNNYPTDVSLNVRWYFAKTFDLTERKYNKNTFWRGNIW